MTAPLTRTQAKILDFIRNYILASGCSPAYREIALHLGAKPTSHGMVSVHIKHMIAKGALRHEPGAKRALAIAADDVMVLSLPRDLADRVTELAHRARVTPQAVVVEALRSRLGAACPSPEAVA
jgi:SOS-response transcriptional repressor LexA